MKPSLTLLLGLFLALIPLASRSADSKELQVFKLWPGSPPDETKTFPPEADLTKPTDGLVAGRRLIRLGNVSEPTLTVFPAPATQRNGAAVIICPGGGYHILAMDLEGTEVAEWLNSHGITALLLKYRVPFRHEDRRWLSAVQDAQRALSLTRHHAASLQIDARRIGIVGFSAGGQTAALATLSTNRHYASVDAIDQVPFRPDFAMLIYSAYLTNKDGTDLVEGLVVPAGAPPVFLAHAYDDGIPVENSVLLFLKLKQLGVPAELHAYSQGGHGYGLRETDVPVTTWHHRAAEWMRVSGFLRAPQP